MREILCDKGSVRGWYNRTRFVYTTQFGRISELGSDRNKIAKMTLRSNPFGVRILAIGMRMSERLQQM